MISIYFFFVVVEQKVISIYFFVVEKEKNVQACVCNPVTKFGMGLNTIISFCDSHEK